MDEVVRQVRPVVDVDDVRGVERAEAAQVLVAFEDYVERSGLERN